MNKLLCKIGVHTSGMSGMSAMHDRSVCDHCKRDVQSLVYDWNERGGRASQFFFWLLRTGLNILLFITPIAIVIAMALAGPTHAKDVYVQGPVYNAPLKEKLSRAEIQALVVDDLATHLDGGESGISWNIHSTTARELQRAFDANEIAAMKKFNWPGIVVDGVAESIDIVVTTPTVKLVSGAPYRPVALFTSNGNDKWLEGIRKGDRVRMGCKNVRMVLKLVALYECVPLQQYVQARAWAYVDAIPALAAKGDEMATMLARKLK